MAWIAGLRRRGHCRHSRGRDADQSEDGAGTLEHDDLLQRVAVSCPGARATRRCLLAGIASDEPAVPSELRFSCERAGTGCVTQRPGVKAVLSREARNHQLDFGIAVLYALPLFRGAVISGVCNFDAVLKRPPAERGRSGWVAARTRPAQSSHAK